MTVTVTTTFGVMMSVTVMTAFGVIMSLIFLILLSFDGARSWAAGHQLPAVDITSAKTLVPSP